MISWQIIPLRTVHNVSGFLVNNVQITGTVPSPFIMVTQSLGDLAPGDTVEIPFEDLGGGPFGADYNDAQGSIFAMYSVSATIHGQAFTSGLFGEENNVTGGCVAFLGFSCDLTEQDIGVPLTTVATLGTPDATPEPSTLALCGGGLLLGMGWRRRRG